MRNGDGMKQLTADDNETRSADIVADNVERLRAIFPEAFREGKVDFDVLKELLAGAVDECEEKYGLTWHGKRRARQLALTSSAGTLRPCPEDSVDWDTTQNLMIEGDNLEVLKLLQKSYAGKVKLIYIDPPYNTGKDFIYPDDFHDSMKNYMELTGQMDGGRKISSNTEASGRFHTDWLNMMYPRVKLARNLLRKDGAILISIDDSEVANLRHVCDDVFGPENFIAEIVWEGANKNDARQIGVCHEYVLAYAHTRESLPREWQLAKEGVEAVLVEADRLKAKHGGDYDAASEDLSGWFRAMKAKPSFAHRRFHKIDARGAYKEDDPTAPGGRRFELRNPRTGSIIPLRRNRGWGFDQKEFERLVAEGRISFISDTSIMVRRYLRETDTMTPQSVFYQPARSASERLARLMGANVFSFPKDESTLQKFVEMASDSDPGCIVFDFFAGSGTTGHAVMAQNSADGGNRRFVLVQLPEPLDPENNDQKAAADFCDQLGSPRNIAALTEERLRRAGKELRADDPMFAGDTGFRVFKLDSSNIRAWEPDRDGLPKTLEDSVEHVKTDRTEGDVLYELLLKLGLDLCVPIEEKTIADKAVHSIGGGVLLVCLAERVTRDEVEPLALGIVAWHEALAPAGDTTCVFRDSAFVDDVAKTNLAAILNQHGLATVRSL
jgi:adenine-specific DNA-methyltransferase